LLGHLTPPKLVVNFDTKGIAPVSNFGGKGEFRQVFPIMCALSNPTRSDSDGSSSSDPPDTSGPDWGEDYYSDLIKQANSVPLIKVFQKYGIRCMTSNFKMRCPFKFHKGGRENTPSFNYYHRTNSFNCFGCQTGGGVSHFVASMDGISVSDAAYKVVQTFKDNVDSEDFSPVIDLDEKLNILVDFSNVVRSFHQDHPEALAYVELACQKLDDLNLKRPNQDNEALRAIIEILKRYLSVYQS
jgi:CHC2-type zinc finger protein